MTRKHITVIDQTIREGMQHRGIVFSRPQREKILKFQEILGIDICQAGYAPAHITEQEHIKHLHHLAQQQQFRICVAGMGRAYIHDVASIVATDINHFHLHVHIPREVTQNKNRQQEILNNIAVAVEEIRKKADNAIISIAVLDIGSTPPDLLELTSDFLVNSLGIDILSLPDTSGTMSPDMFHDRIAAIAEKIKNHHAGTQISVHCHNDLGMAAANTLMGVKAGATVVEVSALGIGERNGIADLFTVGRFLNNESCRTNLNIDDVETFREYYQYISDICRSQTGDPLLNYCTPFFGAAAKTHVAGTHVGTGFGLFQEEDYCLNVLCGKQMVGKYLTSKGITYAPHDLKVLTENIKSRSAALGRAIKNGEIRDIAKQK